MLKTWLVPMALAAGVFAMSMTGVADEAKDAGPVLGNTMKGIDGKDVDLSKYKGKVLLIVNVASYCGATPQYKDLQALQDQYGKDGLAVLGFPCNQFGAQEPGTEKEIVEFCEKTYKVKFDMFSKVDVNGDQQAPLFKYLTSEAAYAKDPGKVKWNFEKFLIGRDGKVVARFRTGVKPSSEEVVKAIQAELAKK
jgi:glutathione peroxidase